MLPKETIYVVSGMGRSGTSAMMGALIAGGVEGNHTPGKDNITFKRWPWGDDYHPNPKGFFEGFKQVPEEAVGKVSKLIFRRLVKFAPKFPINVVVMWRAIEERLASHQAWTGPEAIVGDFEEGFAKSKALHGPNAEWHIVTFSDLIDSPFKVYDQLVRWGFPLTDKSKFCRWIEWSIPKHRIP